MAIYTKKGDKGTTALYDSKSAQMNRVSKDSLRVRAIGAVDELDSFLGLAKTFCIDPKIAKIIANIQRDLLTIGSSLAGSKLKITKAKIKSLEKLIDVWEGELPALSNFILPGGSSLAAQLHVCRSAARRAEREITALAEVEKVADNTKAYINRLSDFMFMLSRKVNFDNQIPDELWRGSK